MLRKVHGVTDLTPRQDVPEWAVVGRPGRCVKCGPAGSLINTIYIETGAERLYGPLCLKHAEDEIAMHEGFDDGA